MHSSIEGPKITKLKESTAATRDEKQEKEKPKIKSDISLRHSRFLSKNQSGKYTAYAKLTEGTRIDFTQEELIIYRT